MDTTLRVENKIKEHEMSAGEFLNHLKSSTDHKKSSSAEFKRQLKLFGFEYQNDAELVELLIEKIQKSGVKKAKLKPMLEKIASENVTPGEENLYIICFALKLSPENTQDLFQKAFGLRGFNFRVINDVVYYYCLSQEKPYKYAQSFLEKCYGTFKDLPDDVFVNADYEATELFKNKMMSELNTLNWESEEDVFNWIKSNRNGFIGYSRTAELRYLQIMFELRYGVVHDLLSNTPKRKLDIFLSRSGKTPDIENLFRINKKYQKEFLVSDKDGERDLGKLFTLSKEKYGTENIKVWKEIRDAVVKLYGDEEVDESLTYSQKYEIAKNKFDFMKPFLTAKFLIWRLFDPHLFCKGEIDSEKQKFDQIPGLPNFMFHIVWSNIDNNPKRLTWRPETITMEVENGKKTKMVKDKIDQGITDPTSAKEWARVDVVGRKVMIIIYFYQFISDCVVHGKVPDGAYEHFYCEINRLLKECGYQPLYYRNLFDCIILGSIVDFAKNYANCPADYKFSTDEESTDFLNEVLYWNFGDMIDSWWKANEGENPVNDVSNKPLTL